MKQDRRTFLKSFVTAIPALIAGRGVARSDVSKESINTYNIDFISEDMDVQRRNEWTRVLPRRWLLRPALEYDRITIHHAGESQNFDLAKSVVVRDMDGIITEHMDRNYGDIGYHFVIDYAGRLWEARSLAYQGAHVSGQNERNIGIVFLGNFQIQKPSEEQLITVEQIVSVLTEHFCIRKNRVFGHCDLGPSACPGANLYPSVLKLRG